MGKITAAITGVGEYLPDYILTNEELSRMVDTTDEWIMSHIGVKTRHILKGEGVGTSYMGARAVINLLDKTGVDPMDIDVVICAAVTPDMFFPSTGNLIADQAGYERLPKPVIIATEEFLDHELLYKEGKDGEMKEI